MENKMSIEEKLVYIRQAIELGADVSLSFHDCRDKEEAEKLASKLSELIHIPVVHKASSDSSLRWLKIDYNYSEIATTIFYDEKETHLEEDVILDGMKEEEIA
jgi:hypothetical protein